MPLPSFSVAPPTARTQPEAHFRSDAREETSKNLSGDVANETDRKGQDERPWVCIQCGAPITLPSSRTQVHGAHQHTFANPHGLLYRIGCFSEAPGCRTVAAPSDEFPWFSGYTWQIGCCTRCGLHLGWLFCSSTNAFHGLILDRLAQDSAGQPPEQS